MSTNEGLEKVGQYIAEHERIPSWFGEVIPKLPKQFETRHAAIRAAEDAGLYVFRYKSEEEMLHCLAQYGFSLRMNVVENNLEVAHDVLTKGYWKAVLKDDTVVAMISRAIRQLGCVIHVDEESGWREVFDTRTQQSRLGLPTGVVSCPTLDRWWWRAERGRCRPFTPSARNCEKCGASWKGGAKSRRRPRKRWRIRCWTITPHIRANDEEIARAASKNICMGLAQRLVESTEQSDTYRPKMQREVVILASADEFRIGKTTIVVNLAGPDMADRVLENFKVKAGDEVRMLRSIKGKWVVIADDIAGFTEKNGKDFKDFQTQTRPSVDDKWKNTKSFPRTDWVVATANDIHIPADQALRSRLLVCDVGARPESKNIPAEVRGKEIAEFFRDARNIFLAGGLLMIDEGYLMEADDSLYTKRREAIEQSSDEQDGYTLGVKKALNKRTSVDKPYARMVDLAREMSMLKFESGDRKGELGAEGGQGRPNRRNRRCHCRGLLCPRGAQWNGFSSSEKDAGRARLEEQTARGSMGRRRAC